MSTSTKIIKLTPQETVAYPILLDETPLSLKARFMYLTMLKFGGKHSSKVEAYTEDLARSSGLTLAATNRAIKELIAAKLVSKCVNTIYGIKYEEFGIVLHWEPEFLLIINELKEKTGL